MEYIRYFPRQHWDSRLGRFQSLAFRPSDDGGISVVEQPCATAGHSLCEHLRIFYPSAGEPPIFWRFSDAILPNTTSIVESPSDTGDTCHRDIINISNKDSSNIFKKFCAQPDDIEICVGNESRRFSPSDMSTV